MLGWVLPGGVIAAGVAFLLVGPGALDRVDLAAALVERYAPVVFGAAGVLAIAFHRSRVLTLVLILSLAELVVRVGFVPPGAGPLVGGGVAVLLGIGAWGRDRGVTSTFGLVQLLGGAGAMAGLVAAARLRPDLVTSFAVPGDPPSWGESVTGFPDVMSACALAGLVAVALAVYRRRGPSERAAFWSLAMVVAAAHPSTDQLAASLLRMGAGLALGLAVLETSYAMAYRDELTGLPARRALMRDLEALTGTYTLAMVDVDHFKKFNDRHGHDVGDQVLRLVASRLGRAPGGGRAYRYGGEEFTLVYHGVGRDEATTHLEAVRASVASARFSLRAWSRPVRKEAGKARRGGGKVAAPGGGGTRQNKKLSVTVSIGVADSTGVAEAGPEAVLAKADKALYRAKRAGRDRVSK